MRGVENTAWQAFEVSRGSGGRSINPDRAGFRSYIRWVTLEWVDIIVLTYDRREDAC
jgi:hypothetical protein